MPPKKKRRSLKKNTPEMCSAVQKGTPEHLHSCRWYAETEHQWHMCAKCDHQWEWDVVDKEELVGTLGDDLLRRLNGDFEMRANMNDAGEVVIVMDDIARAILPAVEAHVRDKAASMSATPAPPKKVPLRPLLQEAFIAGFKETSRNINPELAFEEWLQRKNSKSGPEPVGQMYTSSKPPPSPSVGQLWVDLSTPAHRVYWWNGNNWEGSTPP